ncbi:hypothetical protein JRI60_17625 [Archangium violaceum]|uniref:hypothetical protein n=1 Tax=Archangium violaceum TaxID=83451 RepID=UPI00194DC4B8|nr:hypothetical protein [Archangium violaceum]QRO00717.1 hypothetical protein JRI60_17625 [Archangium violaceum]
MVQQVHFSRTLCWRLSMAPKLPKIPDPDTLVADGFSFSDRNPNSRYRDFAYLSLELGLRAFCGTYEPIRMDFSRIIGTSTVQYSDTHYPITYVERATETILHFQHFAELICKEILRKIHPLLAQENNSVSIIKAIKGKLTDSDISELGLKSHQFSNTVQSITDLNKAKLLPRAVEKTILPHLNALNKLNYLRNRLWHRGTFSLRYQALDQFVGFHLLPFVQAIMRSKLLKKPNWLLSLKTNSGIHPLRAMASSFKAGYNPKRIAILKELARAAYESPIRGHAFSIGDDARIKELAIASAASRPEAESVVDCPVCGVKSLALVEDTYDSEDPDDGPAGVYVFEVECDCCGFCLWSDVGTPSAVGLSLPKYWKHRNWR